MPFQNGSSGLTLILRPATTIERFAMLFFMAEILMVYRYCAPSMTHCVNRRFSFGVSVPGCELEAAPTPST